MTYNELLKIFENTFPSAEIADYRPVCHELFEGDKIGITIWLKNGDMVVYYPEKNKKQESEEKVSKLDDCIADLNYITESLVVLRDIYNSGDCNSCIDKNNCMYCQEPGRLVRYNCPFYHGKEVNKDGNNT